MKEEEYSNLCLEMENIAIEMVKKNYSAKAIYWSRKTNERRKTSNPWDVVEWFTDYLMVMVYDPKSDRLTDCNKRGIAENPQSVWNTYYHMTNEDPEMEELIKEILNGDMD